MRRRTRLHLSIGITPATPPVNLLMFQPINTRLLGTHGLEHTNLGLHFDLNHTPVKFHDCVLHNYDVLTMAKSVHRHINTCQSTPL